MFGLPGNPLSAIVGTALFVLPALRRLRGEADAGPRLERGRLGEPAGPSDNRTTFLISKLVPDADGVLGGLPDRAPGLAHDRRARARATASRSRPHGSGPLPAGAEVDLLTRLSRAHAVAAQDPREDGLQHRGLLGVEVAAEQLLDGREVHRLGA